MSTTLGHELAQLQVYLAEEWRDHGPDHVAELLEGLDDTVRQNLLMINVGSTAAKLPRSQAV